MAYQGGGLLQLWKPDLSTRPGAESAMDSAKFGFLIVAGFRVIFYGLAAMGGGLFSAEGVPTGLPMSIVAGLLLLDLAVPLVAAWRLHVYKGAFFVPVATALYVLGILATLNPAGIVIGSLFTAVFVGGIRGAWALRRGTGFEDDYYATFN